MAVTKIHPIKSTVHLAIRYITNPEKTDEKILVFAKHCHAESAHSQFKQTRDFYQTKGTVLARHLIQSFLPNELTPDLAHEIGKQLCEQLLGEQYEYVLTTHIDRGHIHNHILFNNVSFASGKCYQSNKRTYHHIRDLSDELCRKYHLYVIDTYYETYQKLKKKGISYHEYQQKIQGTSWKSKLQYDIDYAINKARNWEEFISIMEKKDYEMKYGKHIAFKHATKKRFTRGKTIGESYTKEEINKRIKESRNQHKHIKGIKKQRIRKVIDIDSRTDIKENKSYELWARNFNVKTMADSILELRKLGIHSKKELAEFTKNMYTQRQAIQEELKKIEKEASHLDEMMKAAHTIQQHKKVYQAFKNDPKHPVFKEHYSKEIKEFQDALSILNQHYKKMPDTKKLLNEYQEFMQKKEVFYQNYHHLSEQAKQLTFIKNNYDQYMKKTDLER